MFGVASILAPFFFAATLGGVASGRIPVGNRAGDPVTSWLNPTSVLFGALAVTASAFLAAVFLVSDARRYGAPDLEAYFRRRTVLAAGSAGRRGARSAWSCSASTPGTSSTGCSPGGAWPSS